jgi:hypothetical protein
MTHLGAGAYLAGAARQSRLLAWEHRDAILGGGRNLGCKRLIENHPGHVAGDR